MSLSFSLENHVAFTDGIYFEDFVEEQVMKRREFIYKARIGFITDVRRYFRSVHPISESQMAERCAEVCISLIS